CLIRCSSRQLIVTSLLNNCSPFQSAIQLDCLLSSPLSLAYERKPPQTLTQRTSYEALRCFSRSCSCLERLCRGIGPNHNPQVRIVEDTASWVERTIADAPLLQGNMVVRYTIS